MLGPKAPVAPLTGRVASTSVELGEMQRRPRPRLLRSVSDYGVLRLDPQHHDIIRFWLAVVECADLMTVLLSGTGRIRVRRG